MVAKKEIDSDESKLNKIEEHKELITKIVKKNRSMLWKTNTIEEAIDEIYEKLFFLLRDKKFKETSPSKTRSYVVKITTNWLLANARTSNRRTKREKNMQKAIQSLKLKGLQGAKTSPITNGR